LLNCAGAAPSARTVTEGKPGSVAETDALSPLSAKVPKRSSIIMGRTSSSILAQSLPLLVARK
jgi:hypothetical protein